MTGERPPEADAAEAQGSGAVYRWQCPICEISNIGSTNADRARAQALNALTGHVRVTEGDGHGGRYELPGDWEREDFAEYVDVVDG